MGNNDPKSDIQQSSDQSEKYFKRVLEYRYGAKNIVKQQGYFKPYDFKILTTDITFEVKADFANQKYGNIAIEGGIVNPTIAEKKPVNDIVLPPYTDITPSGLIVTESDYYTLFVKMQNGKFIILIIPTLELLYYVKDFAHNIRPTGYDNSNHRGLNNLCRTNKIIHHCLDKGYVDFGAGELLTEYMKDSSITTYKDDTFVEKESDIVFGEKEAGDKKRNESIDYSYIIKMRQKNGHRV